MRGLRSVAAAIAATFVVVGLAACHSTREDSAKVAAGLQSMPSVVATSSAGNGTQININAASSVAVDIEPGSPLADVEAIAAAWYRASGALPNTILAIRMPAAIGGDNAFQIARDGYAEADLPALVSRWYDLTGTYARTTLEISGPMRDGAPYGTTTIVADADPTPAGIADVVTRLRELGDDPGMTWWLQTVPDLDTATTSVLSFSRNMLPRDDQIALLASMGGAFVEAEAVGGLNIEVSTRQGGGFDVYADITAESLRPLPETDVIPALLESDAWPIVRSVSSVIAVDQNVDVEFSVLHHDPFAALDTTDCTRQHFLPYEVLGPVVWAEWPGSAGVTCD